MFNISTTGLTKKRRRENVGWGGRDHPQDNQRTSTEQDMNLQV